MQEKEKIKSTLYEEEIWKWKNSFFLPYHAHYIELGFSKLNAYKKL
jgi:hypothetical protein